MRIHHPLPSLDLEVSPTARFGGYAPVSTPSGVAVADDQTYRFMAVLDGFPHNRWHRDIDWTAGVPSVDESTLFTGVGGPGATRGILAVDSATGEPRWTFAPNGLKADPQRVEAVKVPRTLNVPVTRSVRTRSGSGVATQAPGSTAGGRALEIVGSKEVQVPVVVPQPNSLLPPGHWTNAGIVVAGGKIYGEVERQIVALDQRTGTVVWSYPLGDKGMAHSIVATPQHLLFCMSTTRNGQRVSPWEVRKENATEDALVALRLDNGKPVWREAVAYPGTLALSGGLVYFANGDLQVLGPAERTYHLAANSDRPEDYHVERDASATPAATGCQAAPEVVADAESRAERGDASVLRLTFGGPAIDLIRQARTRRSLIGAAPLLVTLDWSATGGTPPKWSPKRIREYAAMAGQIATTAQPDYLDIAPEVNRYLGRNLAELETVRALLQATAASVHRATSRTRVVVSLNAELLAGIYGRVKGSGITPPPPLKREDAEGILSLLTSADAVGLATEPQTGFQLAEQMPSDYLLALKAALGRKPVLVTRVAVHVTGKSPREMIGEAGFLERTRQTCYWLGAEIVARPEVEFKDPGAWPTEMKVSPSELVELAKAGWNTLPHWKRVSQLSVAPPELRTGQVAALPVPTDR